MSDEEDRVRGLVIGVLSSPAAAQVDFILGPIHVDYSGLVGVQYALIQDAIHVEVGDNVPDGAALDAEGNLYVTCYASHSVYRVTPDEKVSLFAWDPQGTMLASPTNAAFGGANFDEMYFANLSRWHICRARVGIRGQLLANQR